jgi:mannose-6-phosphate isomerase-like protein (cupin superfamily)
MQIIRSKAVTANPARSSVAVANMDGFTTRVHWTDKHCKSHVNDGEEVFAALDGTVDMHYREAGVESVVTLSIGDVFSAQVGCEHVAHPGGEARVLIVEREDSV